MRQIVIDDSFSQEFSINISDTSYRFLINYNSRKSGLFDTGIWHLTISVNGVCLVAGVALVSGLNTMAPYPQVPIDNLWIINVEEHRFDVPRDNLSANSFMFLLDEGEL